MMFRKVHRNSAQLEGITQAPARHSVTTTMTGGGEGQGHAKRRRHGDMVVKYSQAA